MKKITVFTLVASLFVAVACEDKTEDMVLPKNIDSDYQNEAAGADPYTPGPPRP